MSFETEAELSLTVDEGDLQNVRQQIEGEIGTTEVGVTDGGSMSAQSAGGGRRGRRSMRLAQDRTELLADAVGYLADIDDSLSEGGLGGGGGIITELVGVGGETAGDLAIEAGDTVADALTDVITGTAATALGNSVADAVSGSEVDVEGDALAIERPEWVDEPLPVEDVGPIPVEDPGPIEVSVSAATTTTTTTTTAPTSGSSSGRGALQRGGAALDDAGAFVVDQIPGVDPPPRVTDPLSGRGTIAGRPFEALGRGFDTTNPFTSGGFGSGGSTQSGTTPSFNTTVEPRINVSVDGADLVDDVEREVDKKFDEVRDELRDELEDVRGQVDALERGIRGIR